MATYIPRLDPSPLIRELALDLPVGETMRTYCPFCNAKHEESLAISRKDDGLVYICPRIKCGASGFIPSKGDVSYGKKPKKTYTEFKEATEKLGEGHSDFLALAYGLKPRYLNQKGVKYAPRIGRIMVPLTDAENEQWGWWGKTTRDEKPKVLLWTERKAPKLFYASKPSPRRYFSTPRAILVEDCLSALKVSQLGYCGVALLGTHLADNELADLHTYFDRVSIFLDPDAKGKALRMAKEIGLFFKEVDLITADADPKDLQTKELTRLLG